MTRYPVGLKLIFDIEIDIELLHLQKLKKLWY